MKIFTPEYLILGLMALVATAANAQNKEVKMVPVKPTMAQTGEQFFKEFCAVCHGVDGKGAGPAASALKKQPSDLTLISKHNQNKFPTIQVRADITSGEVTAHGTGEMPMWGASFRSISPNDATAKIRINNIVSYIEKLQQ